MINLNFLNPKTKKIFNILSTQDFIKEYILVSGTALSLQIEHRLSEDLDFIYNGEFINNKKLKRNIHNLFNKNYRIIKEDDRYQLDFIIKDIKVTFFSSSAALIPFKVKNFSSKFNKMNIATPEIIATLKFVAISQRNEIRDYYDLYFLAKYKISLNKIIEQTKKIVPNLAPITYSETIIYVDDIPEKSIQTSLSPKEIVDKYEIAEYFVKELKKLLFYESENKK